MTRDGSKSVKFPERLLKVLEQKLQDIAMGRAAGYSDQLIRRTMAKFYGEYMDPTFKRQLKENRKIEELILKFATQATMVLKKEPTLQGDGWKLELNNQIAQFIKMLRECLRSVSHVSPELLSRLESYSTKLAPATSDSGYDSSSTSASAPPAASTSSARIADMELVRVVAALFKISDATAQQEVSNIKSLCTAKAALIDLKTCLKNINSGAAFPGRRDDFDSESAWTHWKTLESTHIQQLLLAVVSSKPELGKSLPSDVSPSYKTSSPNPRPYHDSGPRPYSSFDATTPASRTPSVSSRRSFYGISNTSNSETLNEEDEDEIQVGHNFTFIPSNPKRFYKRLLEICLLADLEAMRSPDVDENEEVPLGILSQGHHDLLNECAIRWRIPNSYKATVFMDTIRQFYERDEVPFECIPEALSSIEKAMAELELDNWPAQDTEYLCSIYGSLFNLFLSNLYHAMDGLPNIKAADINPFVSILEHIRDSGLLERFDVDIGARFRDIQDRIRQIAATVYDEQFQELTSQPGVNRALPLLLMTDAIEKRVKTLDKRFPEPIMGELDIVSLMVEVEVPRFIEDLRASQKRLFESSMNGPTPDVPIQDIFALYRRTKTVVGMFGAFVPEGQLQFELPPFFEPYVRQWLLNTDAKTTQWVEAAVAQDKWESEGPEGHSTSIVDLFDSLKSPINVLLDLEWEDEYQTARFFTALARTVSKALEQYCRSVESLFLSEMFPRPTDYIQPQKQSAWLEKARQLALTGEKRVEPFNFRSESCVKLNNIEAARQSLDNMYNQMEVDKLADILVQLAPPVPDKNDRERFLFSVKISIAEGLVTPDSSPTHRLDTFVTLSNEAGDRLAKTRTIYESNSPRWDETFDISVEKPLWLMLSIRDRALVGKHDTVGRAYLCLDPRRFGDFLAHDLWMDLDSHGRVLVRVSMEGEKDDIQFYFGRAFRSLKRAEGDMLRVFIDKMSPFIQQCLSQSVVKTLVKGSSTQGLDYNKALGGMQSLYRQAMGTANADPLIPLPSSEKPRFRPEELTDVEIEAAIAPLFDYFDANLQTLNEYLSDTAKEKVMTRVWKEILVVIESLLIPPLSEVKSEMKPLSDKEVDIVFKWLKFLRDYFYANGEGPVPLEVLQNQKYRDVLSIRLYYDWHTDELMEECVRMMQQSLSSTPTMKKRAKSVYQQRNLGTIRSRKKEKREEKEVGNGEIVLQILRMRPNTQEFIAQQMLITSQMRAEQEQRAKELEERKGLRRPTQVKKNKEELPPVPPLPS
ncbi:hypothetical protein CYLTODRAFT_357221 [Cylindrobasidium torrendii FP15055 ss-10]|uniref:Uncharacterized protein n=1 Tax=Cylindrobasidium torrendii FP15055 ss-10 TaxID=1314674 RepID=A0A0D7B6P8_9AGAR|nr:hypothetical protein CYLTODRAFT_357221 [Cylindrobasidium torrendii FP15055 ss-10]